MATTQQRRRLSKHELKEDAFTTAIFTAREWIQDNMRLVAIFAGVVVAVIVLAWAGTNYFSGREDTAARLFGEGGVELRSNNLAGAIISFQQVIDEYPASDVAGLACFQLADAHFRQRNFDDARLAYQRYIDEFGDDDMLAGSAWAGLAAIDEQAGDYAAAVEKNIRAADVDPKTFHATEYLRHAMRSAIAAQDTQGALQAFEKLEDNTVDVRVVNLARQTLLEHGFLNPSDL